MPISQKETNGGRAFAFPLFGIVVLLASYWLLTDWHEVPNFISFVLSHLSLQN